MAFYSSHEHATHLAAQTLNGQEQLHRTEGMLLKALEDNVSELPYTLEHELRNLTSCQSGFVPLAKNGLVMQRSRVNKTLHAAHQRWEDIHDCKPWNSPEMDILLVANSCSMIVLIKRDRSFTLSSGLLSVCRREGLSLSARKA